MVFCNCLINELMEYTNNVTILILIDGFLQLRKNKLGMLIHEVTILILIDGFLQFNLSFTTALHCPGHNPYFNRWFSAI